MKPQFDEAALVCQALITRTYKRAKADSVWPESASGPHKENLRKLGTGEYEPCFGRVEVILKAIEVGVIGGVICELHAEWTCSRCKSPYVPGRFQFDGCVHSGEVSLSDVERLLGKN